MSPKPPAGDPQLGEIWLVTTGDPQPLDGRKTAAMRVVDYDPDPEDHDHVDWLIDSTEDLEDDAMWFEGWASRDEFIARVAGPETK